MRKFVFIIFLFCTKLSYAQLGVSYHQSSLPFIGVQYDLGDWLPELRLGTNQSFSNFSLEGVVLYKFINKDEYEFYGGIGGRTNILSGLVIPVGLNVYPLADKNFGVHLEAAPILGNTHYLRGSFGIRYRFL